MLKTETGRNLLNGYYTATKLGAEKLGQKEPVYGVGYPVDEKVYMVLMDTMDERLLYESRTAKDRGYSPTIRLRVSDMMKKVFARRAVCVGTVEELESMPGENNGYKFERLIYKYFNVNGWKHDNKPAIHGGDIQINGMEVQLKYNGATVIVESTLNNFFTELGLA